MAKKYGAVIDAGTTGLRSMIFDNTGNVVAKVHKEYPVFTPAEIASVTVTKILWLKDNRFVLVDAYIYGRLTGRLISKDSNACFSAFDIRKRDWSDEILDATGIARDRPVHRRDATDWCSCRTSRGLCAHGGAAAEGQTAVLTALGVSIAVTQRSMAAYLLPGTIISAPAVTAAGRLIPVELILFLVLLPAILLGHLLSSRYRAVLDRYVSRTLVLSLSSIAACTVLLRFFLRMLR